MLRKAAVGTISGVFLTMSITMSGCGASEKSSRERAGPVIARIDGSPISQSELEHWAGLTRQEGASNQVSTDRALNVLIHTRWLLGEAHELGVSVPAREVKHEAEELVEDEAEKAPYQRMPHDPELRRFLLSPKLRQADRERLIEVTLLVPKIERARLQRGRQRDVKRSQIERFYAKHKRQFYLPNQRQVEIIGGLLADVVQAKREIEGGKPFLEVARRVSIDPEAPGGLWRLLLGHDEPEVEDPIFAARLHVLLGPKKYSEYYIFEVLEAVPAHQETLTEAEAAIRKKLAPGPARLAVRSEQEWIKRTTCRAGYVVARCREYRPRRPASGVSADHRAKG